ncbi:putative uncharacterized protein DDB_G0291812 [Helicoverpa zea]|uniref:putative uncharacterized protein DDB_G0291812 n=1 Tax=Helicoverpa zea TaxID=7113 RepID=UPI001F5AD6A3|nr:putative uncharacterized protein DDB_G0291812 [Helicoverpa zea]
MEGNEEEAKNLEICSYRYLQQVAKSMSLPSNVKRVWLIKLINAKKYGTQQAVEELVRQVRQERQQLSQARKKTNKSRKKSNVQQSTEISSTGNSLSPPITTTPTHRRHVIIRYSPERHSPKKYPENISTSRYNLNRSDRVLRSCNRVKKPSYLLNNTLYNLLNGSDTEDGSEVYNTVDVEKTNEVRGYPKKSDGWKNPHVPLTKNVHTSPPPRSGVQRRISGIYPLHTEEVKVPSVAIRRPDGTITKLRAIIQKPMPQRKYSNDRKTYNTNSSLLRTEPSDWSYTVTTTPQFTHSSTYRSSNMRESTPNINYRQSNFEAETHNDKQSYNTSSLLRTEATDRSYTVTTKPQLTYNSDYPSSNMRESTSNLSYRQSNLEAETHNNKQSCNINSLLRTEPSDWSYTVSTTPQFTCSSPYPSSNMRESTPNIYYRQSNLEAETRNDKQSYNTSSLMRTEAADRSYTVTTKPHITYNTAYPSSNKKVTETHNDRQTYNTSSSLLRTEANNWSVTTKPQMTYSKAYPSSNNTYKPSNLASESQNLNNRPSSFTTAPNYSFRSSNTSEIVHSMCNGTSNMAQMTPSINYRTPNNSIVNTPENNSNSSNSSSSNSSKSNSSEETDISNGYKDESDEYSEYCHKKIRRRKMRSSRKKEMVKSGENEGRLPKIDEAFTKFNNVYSRDVSQPLYVHVEVPEPETVQNTYIPEPTSYQGSSTLEKFYNIKTATAPLLQIYTPSKTTTVYSTPIITTAKQISKTIHDETISHVGLEPDRDTIAIVPRDNQQYYMTEEASPRDFFGDFGNLQGRNSSEDFGRSSVETIASQEQELGANVTIPEMVEDALELISQDGDYMERMGMDIRMQCILCNWAGPKMLFEYHIRKEHASEIIECSGKEWLATYSLGGLRGRAWSHRVLAGGAALYVLSARYQQPECFMAALSTLSEDDPRKRASLTVYNKLTGEPFTWLGDVPEIDADMDVPTGLRVSLPKVDLLPNSANLQLLDRQLVMRSPSNAIVGQPDLDNIHINLAIKIYD